MPARCLTAAMAWLAFTCAGVATAQHDAEAIRLPPLEQTLDDTAAWYVPPSWSPLSRCQQRSQFLVPHADDILRFHSFHDLAYSAQLLGRGYYRNDQRIEWTGQEATFGVEGVLAAAVRHDAIDWHSGVELELYLNQPFDRNVLVDTPERRAYAPNFSVDPTEISQLYLSARRDDLLLAIGKFVTPFGRTYFPVHQNDRSDAPFIRTESIHWRETGVLVQYDPGPLEFTAAVTNGIDDRDTNSSKAVIGRVGCDLDWLCIGASIKQQDGTGSEGQKEFNRHIGCDAMVCAGRWRLSGELIWDEYGLRRPGLSPTEVTWGSNLYYRDLNKTLREPIHGVGYYLNLQYEADRWAVIVNYGEFRPESIGHPVHDVTTWRSINKFLFRLTPYAEMFAMGLLENDVPTAQAGRERQGLYVLGGLQFAL